MQVRRFIRKALIFSLPLLAWVLVVVWVDPFDYFNLSHAFPEQTKIDNAAALNTLVFNMLKEKHAPSEYLIIGDSRAEALPVEYIRHLTGQPYFQLAAYSLKLNESIDLFYFANRLKPVKRAVFTLNFNEFNEYAYADRVSSVEAMIQNPFIYCFDRGVAQAAYYVVKASLTGRKWIGSIPPMTSQEWWDYMVKVRGREHYEKYAYPQRLYQRMQEMVRFAKKQGVEITFIDVPNHADFQKRVRDFGLADQYVRFKKQMCSLGVRVIDYDYLNHITAEKSNFRDPLHYNEQIGRMISEEVFRGPVIEGRLLDAARADQYSQYSF